MLLWLCIIAYLKPDNVNAITVKVGLSGGQNKLIDEAVFQIAAKNFADEGLLDANLSVQLYYNDSIGCGYFETVTAVTKMYYVDGVRALIGPECSYEMGVVASMAASWNIPILGYASSVGYLANKNVYSTLARVSMISTNGLTDSLITLIKHYNWTRVALVNGKTTDGTAERRSDEFRANFPAHGINIVVDVTFPVGATAPTIAASNELSLIRDNARIIVAMFGLELMNFNQFLEAVQIAGMKTNDYIYLIPCIIQNSDEYLIWNGNSSVSSQVDQSYYSNLITVNNDGFQKKSIDSLFSMLHEYSADLPIENMTGTDIAFSMQIYDAFKLYVLTLRSAIEESKNPEIYLNGSYLWQKMRSTSFPGISGQVTMDDIAERIPLYTAYYLLPSGTRQKLAMFDTEKVPNCDGMVNVTGCYSLVLVNISTNLFVPPKDEPDCGYTGSKCKNNPIAIALPVCICLLIIGIVIFIWFYRRHKERQLYLMPWLIQLDELFFIESINGQQSSRSLASIKSSLTAVSQKGKIDGRRIALLKNIAVTIRTFAQNRPISLHKAELQLLVEMRQIAHDNINQFIGMCFNNSNMDLMVIWKHCSRGTLRDLIKNNQINFDDSFKCAFARDIVQGLEYLHSSPIGFHGHLCARNCLIDSHWNLKLSDYGLERVIYQWKMADNISVVAGDLLPENDWLFLAPEIIFLNRATDAAESDARIDIQPEQLQLGDVYSFGMLLYQILFCKEPYEEMDSFAPMMAVLNFEPKLGQQPIRPIVPKDVYCHPDLITLMRQCWSQQPHLRPSIRRVKKVTDNSLKSKGSLVDQMLQMINQYSTNLEKTVKERTALLEEAKRQSESLLQQILPKQAIITDAYKKPIARDLRMGHPIRPKNYKSVTVLYCDIVGFTRSCSTSTPMEVVALLNSLFSAFDNIIQLHDACKIESVGDSYLVVSGIPKSNGNRHAMNIANIALEMMKFLEEFRVPHRPSERVHCRWGCHSGPVTAAVVGKNSPRYIVFGETVNIASRMEKSSMKGMIHLSAATSRLLESYYPEFKCRLRGQFNIEGIGPCTTFHIFAKHQE